MSCWNQSPCTTPFGLDENALDPESIGYVAFHLTPLHDFRGFQDSEDDILVFESGIQNGNFINSSPTLDQGGLYPPVMSVASKFDEEQCLESKISNYQISNTDKRVEY